MTMVDGMELLKKICSEQSQAEVARAIEYSPGTISQVLSGTYRGSSDLVLQKVVEVYGGLTVACPERGEIALRECAVERVKPYATVSSDYARQRNACRRCKNNPSATLRDHPKRGN